MRILVLVIASHNKPEYLQMEQLWLATAPSRAPSDSEATICPLMPLIHQRCDVWLVHSKPAGEWVGDIVNDSWIDPENIEVDNRRRTIYVKQDECLIPGILAKTVKALEWASDHYDYVWRTNLSSVLDFDGLYQYCLNISKNTGFYGGYIGKYQHSTNILLKKEGVWGNYQFSHFASGAGFLMSRDVVEYLMENQSLLRWDLIDDVAIGLLLEPVFGLVHIERQWIQSLDEPINSNVFHYRCESYMHMNTVAYMQKVINYYNIENG
jgi:hypothetical protein